MLRPITRNALLAIFSTLLSVLGVTYIFVHNGPAGSLEMGLFASMCFLAVIPPGPLLTLWLIGSVRAWQRHRKQKFKRVTDEPNPENDYGLF